jgi:imidazolonepropionase-like amidohydrolase
MNWKFNAQKASASEDEKKQDKKKNTVASSEMMSSMRFPNVGMGKDQMPKSEHLLFKNATVWTGEEILEQTDVHIKNGKIVAVGKNLNARGAQQIDATGKHLTAGIVDEHSHIGAFAINEGGQNSSAEVRMADVVDAKDIDIYRNLAGGVTTIQLLHGSANPIGGQSAILRLKWGNNAEELLFEGADPYIKFALGENVKQSNWQSFARFPQTRMGVEQTFVDYFTRAQDYMALKESGAAYRVDEELETLAEILRGERFISCHSYVQSEINMLMKVADRFGFRVNTFTHILEGYKVADKMKNHGVGGSTFSDWWAYKYEVKDAIPYNAAIMSREGVTVAINSDDAEMSRRLNQEAAKTVKYGGLSEIEAWKMVTLNPAKLLHIDDKVGSIAVGKEADVVLWSDHPLSIYAYAEKTIIQGQTFFDFEKDKELQERNRKERMRLIKAMLNVTKKEGGETQTPVQNKKRHFECETI